MDPKYTRIPDEPDQSDFIRLWFDYHRGYRVLKASEGDSEERVPVCREMQWKDVSPGHLPVMDPLQRLITIRGNRPVARQQEHVSLDSTLDSLLQEASDEQDVHPPVPRRRSTVDPRETRATAFQSRIPTPEEIQEAHERIIAVSRRRQELADQLDVTDAELRRCRHRHAQLLRERQTAQNMERVFGTREEVRNSGASYVSPLSSMFSRAYERYAIAEEVRAEERASNRNAAHHRQQIQELIRHRHGTELFVREQTDDDTLQDRLQTLDDETVDRPAPLNEDEMIVKLGCRICLQQKADVCVLPCGHLVMCSWCANIAVPTKKEDQTQPARRNIPCPLCRKHVKKVARVYTA